MPRTRPPEPPASPAPADVSDDWLLSRGGRPVFVFAHQDDELVMAGLIRRVIGPAARFIWWTNGDGLAPAAHQDPEDYARVRIAEATESLRRLGGAAHQKVDLASSEIENYRRLTQVARCGAPREAALAYFRGEARRVEEALRDADPDRAFVLAWQGGHPEHDLTHVFVARALRRLRRETGRPIPLVQCPAYEYLIANPMRFKPWFRGDVRALRLRPDELDEKQYVMRAYPSQFELLAQFKQVLSTWTWLASVLGGPATVEDFLSREQYGVVAPDVDYTHSTHHIEWLNYINDDYEGIPIRFETMIRPIVEDLLRADPS